MFLSIFTNFTYIFDSNNNNNNNVNERGSAQANTNDAITIKCTIF